MVSKSAILRWSGSLLLIWALFGCSGGGGALDVGGQFPEFTIASATEPATKLTLADLKGKPVLIDFWATWCGPCRMAFPHIQSVWKSYKDKGLQVLTITDEDAALVKDFRNETKLEVPMYIDQGQKLKEACGVAGLPTTVVIDKNGKVIYSVMGTSSDTENEIDAAVAKAML